MSANEQERTTPPRDNLVRGLAPSHIEVRDEGANGDGAPTLYGHFSVFDSPYEVNSAWEGNFVEQIAAGAFKKTIRENRDGMRVLLQHGQDPQLGDKPIGAIRELREDDVGAYYEAELFRSVPDLVMDGLRAGQYGASFRFRVMREEWEDEPDPTDLNPRGLPLRTIKEAQVMEFGPVTWGANPVATAGVRSLTDEWRAAHVAALVNAGVEPGAVIDLLTTTTSGDTVTFTAAPDSERTVDADATSTTTDTASTAAPSHPAEEPRRDTQPATNTTSQEAGMSIEEMRARMGEIKRELEEIATEHAGAMLDAATQARWDGYVAENEDLSKRSSAEETRRAYLAGLAGGGGATDEVGTTISNPGIGQRVADGTGTYVTSRTNGDVPSDVFDVTSYHKRANDQEHMRRLIGDGARRAIETFNYPHPRADRDAVNAHLESILATDSPDKEIALRMLNCGSPLYRRAYYKHIAKQPLTSEEQRALAVGATATGGAAVPVQVDPTLISTANQALNPLRAISRVFTTTSYIWQGVTSGGITAQFRAEGARMSDNSPALVAPTIQPERADAFVPFSWELGQDWTALESALAPEFQDAKDYLEATKFAVGAGHGSNEPQGILVGAGTLFGSAAATAFSSLDVYALEAQLPARYIPNASWVATPAIFQKVRQFATAAGPGVWADSLVVGNPPTLLGYPAYKATNIGTAGSSLVSSVKWGVFGDFSRFAIVDRLGMETRVIDNLFSGNTAGGIAYPTGQSGIVMFWRTSSGVLDSNAFRTGTID